MLKHLRASVPKQPHFPRYSVQVHRQFHKQQQPKRLYAMAQHGHSAACCSIPPIVAKGYEAKGTYETIGGLKTYVTGPTNASKAILFVFDIFGYFPQTLQGADILSTSDKDNNYQVFMPEFFEGEPADISWFPPDNKDKEKKLGAFFQNQGAPPKTAGRIPDLVKEIEKQYSNINTWGVIGFCWGGKIVSIVTSNDQTPFKAGVECHPAMVDPKDALNIKVPLAMLASKDEDAADVKKFEENLKVEKYIETFGDQIHGWMGARADLEDERNKTEYERGWKTVLQFFGKHL